MNKPLTALVAMAIAGVVSAPAAQAQTQDRTKVGALTCDISGGIGMIIAAMYLLYMVGKVVFGPLVEPHGHDSHGSHGGSHGGGAAKAEPGVLPTDLNLREILTLTPLAVLCIALGVYPKPVLDVIQPPISDTVRVLEAASQPVPTPLATDAPMGEEGAR